MDPNRTIDKTVSPTISPKINDSNIKTIDAKPTISPVIDDKSMSQGINSISAIVTSLPEQVTANLTAQIDANRSIYHVLEDIKNNVMTMGWTQDQMKSHFGYLLDSIDANTLEVAGWVMGGPNIYMDTGSLVGAIAPEMDNALGMSAILSQRGV